MSLGKIEAFDPATGNWKLYAERFEQYFLINDTKEHLKVPTLITAMGGAAYELLVTLCTPNKPAAMTFKEVVKVMSNHLQPKPSILAERYRFRQRKQKNGETIAEYVAELKKLAMKCEFKTMLDENLRDQLVCGLSCETTRQRLFAEEEIDLKKALALAHALEAAEKNAAAVNVGSSTRGEEAVASSHYQMWSGEQGGQQPGRAEVYAVSPSPRGTRGGERGRSRGRGARTAGHSSRGAAVAYRAPTGAHGRPCRVCGALHDPATCKFRVYVCRICNEGGHLKRMCPRLSSSSSYNNYMSAHVDENSDDSDSEVTTLCYNLRYLNKYKPYLMTLEVSGKPLCMEIDTGSTISCIGYDCYSKLFSKQCKLEDCNLQLRYYTGENVKVMGKITPAIRYNNITRNLNLYVIRNAATCLIGREWLEELGIMLPQCNMLRNELYDNKSFNLDQFSSRYADVFADGLGRFTGGTVGLRLREGAQPVFMRARPLPFAMREPVERALDQMVSDGIIAPVETSDWATPIVPVVKSDGTIRICGDYKMTLNKYLEIDRYPVPRIDDLLIKLNGGEKFSKIDLSQAYAQFPLDESKKYTTICTHKGLFQYNRLIYGLASSPGIFQRKLEQIFGDLPTVGVYLDDVIITAKTDEEHLKVLHTVFQRLQKYGLKIKKEKCAFFQNSVTYLGYVITKEGIGTCPNKIQAIQNIPVPRNTTEVRAFIGMVMYYAKFINNITETLAPLYTLLKKNSVFDWSEQCQKSFIKIKALLGSSEILAHYSPDLPLVLTTDASNVGVGAVIAHRSPSGVERPIAYASRVLNDAEKGYSQIEKEALAIIYGVKKFHQYLYGRRFTLRTDHKPLVTIFGSKHGIPVMAAGRLQRWAVLLSGYTYDIEYVASASNGADALSRLPSEEQAKVRPEVTYLNFIQDFLPITCEAVREATRKDSVLAKVLMYVTSGWPSQCNDAQLRPYFLKKNELYLEQGCVLWGYRVVIPDVLKKEILKELHVGHMGVVKMKSIARSYVWWPGLDQDIEETSRECSACAAEANAPPAAPPQPWPYSPEPWTRVHIDFLGPLDGETFLVLVDSSTKWIEAFRMKRMTSASVIKILRETFARFGLPRELVSDNFTAFSCGEFKQFLAQNGIKQSFSPPYHPASNGAAENAVKLCKKAIKKAKRSKVDVDAALQAYLMAYRNTPHSTTGEAPSLLLQRRVLRSRLDLLRGSRGLEDKVRRAQQRQVENAGGVERSFVSGDQVWTREHSSADRWLQGQVQEPLGSRRYLVKKSDGTMVKKHIDQLRLKKKASKLVWSGPNVESLGGSGDPSTPTTSLGREREDEREREQGLSAETGAEASSTPSRVTRSGRNVKPVVRYGLEID